MTVIDFAEPSTPLIRSKIEEGVLIKSRGCEPLLVITDVYGEIRTLSLLEVKFTKTDAVGKVHFNTTSNY